MPIHEYNPQQALESLMAKLKSRDEELAAEVQAAIDAGKDVAETEPIPGRRKRHVYRRTVPFSSGEALQIALNVLQAYFVEQPLFVDSAANELANAGVGVRYQRQDFPRPNIEESESVSIQGVGEEKSIEVEIQTETQILRAGEETLRLPRVATPMIEEQWQQVRHLRELIDFR